MLLYFACVEKRIKRPFSVILSSHEMEIIDSLRHNKIKKLISVIFSDIFFEEIPRIVARRNIFLNFGQIFKQDNGERKNGH